MASKVNEAKGYNEILRALPKRIGQASSARGVLAAALGLVLFQLRERGKVRLPGFGTFEVHTRPARLGVHPVTRERLPLPATKEIRFRPSRLATLFVTGRRPS